jgi:lipopolysaccharide assembly protein A
MQFLKTVFWVLLAVLVALFGVRNWADVTLNLWGDIQADVKVPILLLIAFLLGWLPTWLIMRARLWGMKRRIEAFDRQRTTERTQEAMAEETQSPVI